MCMCATACMWRSEKNFREFVLLWPCGFQGVNSDQTCLQAPLLPNFNQDIYILFFPTPPKLIIVCIFKVNFICVCVGVHKQMYAGTHTYVYAWRWKEGAGCSLSPCSYSFDSGSYPCTWDSFSLLDWKSANSRNLPVSAVLLTWSWGYRCLWGCPCYMGARI